MLKTNSYRRFAIDLIQNERLRARILGIVMLWILLGFLINYIINFHFFDLFLINKKYWLLGVALMLLLVIRSFIIARFIPKIHRIRGSISLRMQIINGFVDISIISLILITFANQLNPYNALISPVIELYIIVILLSILEMDFRVSAFVGAMASVQYIVVYLYFSMDHEPPEELPFLGEFMYYGGRGMIFLITGIVSGMIAQRIKKGVLRVLKHEDEKTRLEKLFGQQLSPDIANEVLNNTATKPISREACILFLDIKDFTPHTASLSPEQIIDYQNIVFPDTFDTIFKYKGIINQVMGDGFMATFGAPISSDEACENALKASLEIIELLQKKNKKNPNSPTYVRIGMHYGPIVTGNIGSETRKQYSVTGLPVIIASRLEQLNKETNTFILFSENVMAQLKSNFPNIKPVGRHTIKGFSQPMLVYTALCAFEKNYSFPDA